MKKKTSEMEIIVVLSILLFLALVIRKIVASCKSTNGDAKLPPGPRPLPFIGSLHHFMGSTVLPHHIFHDLSKKYGPLMHLKVGEVNMVIASSPEAAKEIMITNDVNFAARPPFPSVNLLFYSGKAMVFAPYGEYWRQIRKMCIAELLSPKQVLSLRSTRQHQVRNLIQSIYASSTSVVNLGHMLRSTVNNIAVKAAAGDEIKNQPEFLDALRNISDVAGGFYLSDLFPSLSWILGLVTGSKYRLQTTHNTMDRVLDSIIQERSKSTNKSSSFIDVLLLQLHKQEEFPSADLLTLQHIKAITTDLSIGGSETSSTLLQWAMSELMKNPRVMKRAQLEVREALRGKAEVTESDLSTLSYLKLVIKETMRMHPPDPLLLPRECRKECRILGYRIPEKTRVFVNIWTIGRDPDIWKDPEEFKPERFQGSDIDFKGTNMELMPFGAGRRSCPGITFAMAIVEPLLAQLLYYFDWELPDGIEPDDLDMSETFGVTAHRTNDLCLRAIPHIPPPTY